jgi:hypothetical protein
MKTPMANERGIALVTALLFTMLSLGIVMALLYMVGRGTQLSGMHKKYKSSLEASHGGVQLIARDIIPRLFNNYSGSELARTFNAINLQFTQVPQQTKCLNQKLGFDSSTWLALCGPNSTSLDPKVGWDMSFRLQGTQGAAGPGYNVYAKIVDTMPGNSDTSGFEQIDAGAGVTGSASGLSPKHVPALYRIETRGESTVNSRENAALTVLYAY